MIIVVVYNYVCECTVSVDVRDGTPKALVSILSNVVVGYGVANPILFRSLLYQ